MRAYDIVYVGGLPRAPAVDDALHVGGMGVIAANLLQRLAARGHGVRTLSAVAENDPGGRFVGLGPNVETNPYAMPRPVHNPTGMAHFENHGVQIRAALPALLNDRRPDIVLVGHHAYIEAFPDALGGFDIPWLVWIHTTILPATLFGDGKVPEPLAQRMMTGMRAASGLIGVANHIAQDLTTTGARTVAAVPNGVDLDLFRPRPDAGRLREALRLPNAALVVVHVSNLKKIKRVDVLVRSAENALIADPNLIYVIIGEGPFRHDLDKLAADRGLSDRIVLTGWLPRHEVADFLAASDIAILPSAAEGLSLSLLEALASGCAVIASDIASSREVIVPGVSGILFPVGDTEALTRHTLDLASDPVRRAALSAAGRRRVEEQFGLDQMVEGIEAVIERTVLDGCR